MFKAANKSEKVSDSIIAQIRDAILSGQLKPGDRLASEKELIEQFNVSKATMREALRVLEVIGMIEMRKGIAGGAFVAEVGMRTTIQAIINFLHFQTVSIREITMLRYLIEPAVAEIAAIRRTDKDVEKLEKIIGATITPGENEVSKEISFHRYLARMSENAILTLTVDLIDNLLKSLKTTLGMPPEFYEHVREAHELILECIRQKDPFAAKVAMTNDLVAVGRFMCKISNTPPFDPAELYYHRTPGDFHTDMHPGMRVVAHDAPALKEKGVLFRRVGDSQIYLIYENGRVPQMEAGKSDEAPRVSA
ncbi:MAG: FadR/GntR family transcriptional regulator [Deltaproteobacteria bacterium]|nr:FadR/GntR family transcriptional regulator [Deltaproteobacteria bacterium]